ncbi:MAG TPA: phosphate ABC transporter substrate-binding protein PstS [Acidobacteriaceae bacterium]|nr:phosphate ABC transporter substrate-binding protein PstS [Acidobacteriaceae bacterium]
MTVNTLFRNAASAVTILSAFTFLTSCKSGPGTITLNGAGSTFVYPVMGRWIQDFQNSHKNVQINYQSIGSGGGIQQVKSGTIDFGASDAPLSDADMAQMAPVVQIPESAGPVCVAYNLDGLQKPLQLSAEALAGIFLGKITTWQDPLLKKDNPGEKLPNTKIVVVHRAESSGTTAAFTTYLAAVSPDWSQQVGKGTAVKWPTGLGAKGSEGVTGQVKQFPGSISYVELTYATQNSLPVAAIKNQSGKYVLPSTASTTAAIAAFTDELTKDDRTPIANPPASAPDAYPISTLTFLIIPKDGPDVAKRTALKQFITYVVTDGQAAASGLNYAPLPDAVKQLDVKALDQLTAAGKPIQ